jgi:hypothetical protein
MELTKKQLGTCYDITGNTSVEGAISYWGYENSYIDDDHALRARIDTIIIRFVEKNGLSTLAEIAAHVGCSNGLLLRSIESLESLARFQLTEVDAEKMHDNYDMSPSMIRQKRDEVQGELEKLIDNAIIKLDLPSEMVVKILREMADSEETLHNEIHGGYVDDDSAWRSEDRLRKMEGWVE